MPELGPTDLAFLMAVRESGASAADRKRLSAIMLNLASDAAPPETGDNDDGSVGDPRPRREQQR
jgi:hypothetical protein